MTTVSKNYLLIPFDKMLTASLRKTCRIEFDTTCSLWFAPNKRVYDLEILVPYHIKYVDIPFRFKDEGKKLGFKYNFEKKQWFTSNRSYDENIEFFERIAEEDALFAPDA